jgi:putative phosphoribosyl transferase
MMPMKFRDRRAAGRILAESIKKSIGGSMGAPPDLANAIVLALPRGGVPVAYEVACALGLPLDVLAVRKLGAPGQRELAVGAVTSNGTVVLNEDILQGLRLGEQEIQSLIVREREHAECQEQLYRRNLPPLAIEGRVTILVDDGLATGATMRAAVKALRSRASKVVVAVPVGAAEACHGLKRHADLVVCPHTPMVFDAVGQFYLEFGQTSDAEVCRLLAEARCGASHKGAPS